MTPEGVYAVALEPDTGKVLCSGDQTPGCSQDLSADALGTVTNVFVPGSVVKGATLTSGWENGAISGNQVLTDQPIVLQDQLLSILGLPNTVVVPSMRWKHGILLPIPIWSKLPLKMMGQPYTPKHDLTSGSRRTGYEKNCALLLQSMVLGHQRGLTSQ